MQWQHILDKYLPPPSKWTETSILLSTFHQHFEEEKAKINYLKERFSSANDQKTLYIISAPMLAHETLVKVRDALTFFRDGNK
jgi:hypothetical protein